MKRTAFLPALAAGLVATGAKSNELGQALLLGGVAAALLVVLGLPLGLLLHGVGRGFLEAQASAVERRATACVLVGAGLVVAGTFVFAVLWPRAAPLAVLECACAAAWFFVGFAGSARLHGERMLGRDGDPASPRTLALGWLARAGLFAVPVAWPFLATYLVVAAFGAPVVALLDRGRADGAVTS